MKKIFISGALVLMLIIGFAHESEAQVVSTTTPVVLSAEDKATLIATLTQEIQDLLVQLIAQLKLELQAQVTTEVTAQVASTTQATTVPVFGSISTPMTNPTQSVDIGKVSVQDGQGNVPLIINVPSYVSGVARVKGSKVGGADYGVVWSFQGTIPSFESLPPDSYTYSIRLYNKPYKDTNQGTTTDFTIEKSGEFVVPAQ